MMVWFMAHGTVDRSSRFWMISYIVIYCLYSQIRSPFLCKHLISCICLKHFDPIPFCEKIWWTPLKQPLPKVIVHLCWSFSHSSPKSMLRLGQPKWVKDIENLLNAKKNVNRLHQITIGKVSKDCTTGIHHTPIQAPGRPTFAWHHPCHSGGPVVEYRQEVHLKFDE